MPPSAFLYDIGNVLLRFDFSIALRALSIQSEVKDPAELLGLLDPLKFMLEDGRIDRPAFLRGAFDAIRFTGSEADFVSAWEDIFEENQPMVDFVASIHGRFPLYLLSNTNDIHVDFIFRRYPVFGRFTDAVYSHAARVAKPDPNIYQIACEKFGIEPEGTFFIDDLLPNIETARALGFRTHHYHHERHEEFLAAVAAQGVTF